MEFVSYGREFVEILGVFATLWANMWTASKIGVVLTYLCCFHTVLGASISESDDEWAKHHNYDEMLGVLEEVHEKCPSISYLYNLTGHPDHTTQDRRLAVLVLSDNPERHEIGTTSCASLIVTVYKYPCKKFICCADIAVLTYRISSSIRGNTVS